jgi:O-antigen/teichoic acid export membrane protein
MPSTQGMTTKVVKGSLWALAGTILPFVVTFFATPLIIRILGSEGYGVLILIGLIPSYFIFADFGMGIASTKFGSEAYSKGLKKKEGEVVRTASVIAFSFALPFAFSFFFFSHLIITNLNVPENWRATASIGLKITSVIYILGILSGIVNTPQLSRLRMDLNSLVNTVPRIILPILTVIVLYFNGGVVGAIWVSLFISVLTLSGHIFFSGSLLPELYSPTINKSLFSPLLKFGSGWLIGSVAGILLVNLEKVFLTHLISVQSLAYYTVAFNFANLATVFSSSMMQSLVPAFSQLILPEKQTQFDELFSRGIRLNLIWLFPALMLLFIISKPFFTTWAGEEFGNASTYPFYILILGLFFNVLAYIPLGAILASGRTDVFAKLYWIELVLYLPLVIGLITYFGIMGAAMAWSLRVIIDAFVMFAMARKMVGITFRFTEFFSRLFLGFLILLPPLILALFYDNFSIWVFILEIFSLTFYSLLIWNTFIKPDERDWIRNKVKNLMG